MAGLIQLLFCLIRPLGRMLDLISEPVINGMICGIGLFLIFRSLTTFGGLPLNTEVEWPLWIAWQSFLAILEIGNLHAIEVGLITLVTCAVVQQFDRLRNWAILFGIAAGTLYSQYLSATRGLQNTLIEEIGNLSSMRVISPSLPLFNQESMPDVIAIVPGAVTLALLGLFQTVAAMRRMSRKAGGFTDSRKAIFSDAVSNCLLPFLSSLPTCASFNRMWLVHKLGIHSRITIASSGGVLLLLVLFFAKADRRHSHAGDGRRDHAARGQHDQLGGHQAAPPESPRSGGVHGVVPVGACSWICSARWWSDRSSRSPIRSGSRLNPNISLRGNVLKIRGNIYYGSLPVIESIYHDAIDRVDDLIIDFSECYYIDPEGVRWLAAAKAARKVGFVDRRGGEDRRSAEDATAPEESDAERRDRRERRARRDKPDRRKLSEF